VSAKKIKSRYLGAKGKNTAKCNFNCQKCLLIVFACVFVFIQYIVATRIGVLGVFFLNAFHSTRFSFFLGSYLYEPLVWADAPKKKKKKKCVSVCVFILLISHFLSFSGPKKD